MFGRVMFRTLFFLAFFVLFFATAFATSFSASVNGNAFSSASGDYSTNTHCENEVCSWIEGNQAIIGVYNSGFVGGSLTYNFTIPSFNSVSSAKLTIEWPNIYGKGLHSLYLTGVGVISVNSTNIATLPVSSSFRCPNDFFAHSCSTYKLSYNIPVNLISTNTAITISTNYRTVWDIGKVTLTVDYTPSTVSSNNSICGTVSVPSTMIAGNEYVVFVDVANSGSSQWDVSKGYRLGSQDPQDNFVWGFNRVSKVCNVSLSNCSLSNVVDLKPLNVVPGTSNWYRFYFKVKAPSSPGSYNFSWRMVQDGVQWFGATCRKTINVQSAPSIPNTVTISNGKIYVNGVQFLVKGVDYAPWLFTTGPDPTQHRPFPNEYDDVTNLVTNSGRVVPDYSGDGRIQTWEVLRFDVEKMKSMGINTIRTYAVGGWHDKDLDGVIDYSSDPGRNEIVQGDLPDWAVDRILMYAQQNNLKVIMGYWIQEEDFKQNPPVVNWDDLKVAKQALGRIVNKYKDNPAVLAWGIGNEVSGFWNQGWFSWEVPVNDYLNQLNSYVRSLDSKHPIIYAKWVGENANFNNLNADIISVNTYTNSVQDMWNAGEFSTPAPQGKAYMLGEFGHVLSQATDHWNLAKQYAGGCFLEFNNVWWKGSGHDVLGAVDAYRFSNEPRYSFFKNLYSG